MKGQRGGQYRAVVIAVFHSDLSTDCTVTGPGMFNDFLFDMLWYIHVKHIRLALNIEWINRKLKALQSIHVKIPYLRDNCHPDDHKCANYIY